MGVFRKTIHHLLSSREPRIIYANFNPKYAQQTMTILRVWRSTVLVDQKKETPAQRLSIAYEAYGMKDIFYF